VVNQKANFSCNDNLTVLPNGKLCNCYVSYFSSGQSGSLLYDDLDIAIENSEIEQITLPERCKDCNLMFDCCNKCYGNLLEYQRLTGNEFFSTYCDLINSLSKTYIRFLLTEVDTNASIVITQKDKILSFQNINGAMWRLEPAERL
jgi:radical SAM protein with 4Fe4S-binding SPASM domain